MQHWIALTFALARLHSLQASMDTWPVILRRRAPPSPLPLSPPLLLLLPPPMLVFEVPEALGEL